MHILEFLNARYEFLQQKAAFKQTIEKLKNVLDFAQKNHSRFNRFLKLGYILFKNYQLSDCLAMFIILFGFYMQTSYSKLSFLDLMRQRDLNGNFAFLDKKIYF